jgi:hypothetical protein
MKELSNGRLFMTASSGKQEIQTRGFVRYGELIDFVSVLGLSEKKTDRIKEILTYGSDQIWAIFAKGGVITSKGQIIVHGGEQHEFVSKFFVGGSSNVFIKVGGLKFENLLHNNSEKQVYLSPREQAVVIKDGAGKSLGFYETKGGGLQLIIGGDRRFGDINPMLNAVKNRFQNLFSQTGIPLIGVISPQTLAKNLLINIAHNGGESLVERVH